MGAYLELQWMIKQALQKAIMHKTDPRLIKYLQKKRGKKMAKCWWHGRKQSQLKVRAPWWVPDHEKEKLHLWGHCWALKKLTLPAYVFSLPRRRLVADKLFIIDFPEPWSSPKDGEYDKMSFITIVRLNARHCGCLSQLKRNGLYN